MLILFVLFVWLPLLIFLIRRFGYGKVWGCTAIPLLILFVLFLIAMALK